MAIKPKGSKITGTKKKDKITWVSSSAWKKALTVYAGSGNDIINFKKSRYKNKLYGQAGNDTIYGGTKNDSIAGGTGKDKLYGYIGNDTIKGGTYDDTVYGGNNNDKIYGGSGKDYLYGGKGNDYIDGGSNNDKIYGNYGTNTLKGGIGNDSIYGGTGSDKIWGGKGSDYIKAGKGTNTIYHNTGDGSDIIANGSGIDMLVFGGVSSINDLTPIFTGNNVVLSKSNGEVVTLQNALTTVHSVKSFQVGGAKYNTDVFRNYINSTDDTVNGTAWHDDIQFSEAVAPIVYAGAGNDIVHVTYNSNSTYVYVGEGDDTVCLDDSRTDCNIYFENGDGNNALIGLSDSTSILSEIYITSNGLYHSIDLGDSLGNYDYIAGVIDGNDLVLELTGSETFTIENYNMLNQEIKERISIKDKRGDTYYKLSKYLKMQDDIVNVDDYDLKNGHYNITDSNKFVTSNNVSLNNNKGVIISGNNNEVIIKGQDENIAIPIGVEGNNNNFYLSGSFNVNLMNQGQITDNKIFFDGKIANISTANGGSTFIEASNNYSSGADDITIVSSYGSDTFNLKKGRHKVSIAGNYDETVILNDDTNKVEIFGAEVSQSTTIIQNLTEVPSDIMFEHYANWKDEWNYDNLAIRYIDEDGGTLNSVDCNELIFNGVWEDDVFNLDNAIVGDKVTVNVKENDTVKITKTLSQMMQYVNMNQECFHKMFLFDDKNQNGLLDNRAGIYIKGSDTKDIYNNYSFENGKVTINDAGGYGDENKKDILTLDMERNKYRFFIDIDKFGNSAGNADMFIYTHTSDLDSEAGCLYDGLLQHLYGNEDNINTYIKIEGQVEATAGHGLPGVWYFTNNQIEIIKDNTETSDGFNLIQYFYNINMDVASWITSYNTAHGTECNTVSQAIADGKATTNEINSLYSYYCNDSNWANY